MKKVLMPIMTILMCFCLLVGCGTSEKKEAKETKDGTLSCSKVETDEDGYKTTDKIVVTYKDNIVTNMTETSIQETDPDYIDLSYGFTQAFATIFNVIDGIKIDVSKPSEKEVQTVTTVDYTALDFEKIKEAFSDLNSDEENTTENLYEAKNISLEEYKEEYLSDYTCE